MEDPGSFAGKISSPMPQRGPDPNHLISLAIFINEQAKVFRVPLHITTASCAAKAANLLSAETKGKSVILAISWATFSANSGWVFNPVPTAVPPIANSYKSGKLN